MMNFAITGSAGTGKDSVADILCEMYPTLTRYALADPIKQLANRWLGMDEAYEHRTFKESLVVFDMDAPMFGCLDILIYDMFKEHLSMPEAKAAAKVIINTLLKGSMYCNVDVEPDKVAPQYLITTPRWVWQVIGTEGFRDTIRDTFWLDLVPTEGVVITDVRFENEAVYVSEQLGCTVLSVERNGMIPATAHSSEVKLHGRLSDYAIENNGTLHDLKAKVGVVINLIKEEEDDGF